MFPRFNPAGSCSPLSRLCHLLGIAPDTEEVHDVVNRPVPISYGKVIHDIIA